MVKDIVLHVRVDSQTANRLEVDRQEKEYNSIADQFEKVIWFYLSHEAGSETERRRYQEKLLAFKIEATNNAMREDNKQGIINNVIEMMVRLFLYKRLNLNKSRIESYTLEIFTLFNLVQKHDKILFDEILVVAKAFGIKSNKYRSFVTKNVISDTGICTNNTTITNEPNNSIETEEQYIKAGKMRKGV